MRTTMASSTPPSRNAASRIFVAVIAAALSVAVLAAGIGIGGVNLRRDDSGVELDADFDLQLNPSLEQALQRGLPLYFDYRLTVSRPRWYWLDDDVLDATREVRLTYHALSRQYRVSIGSLHLGYPTLPEALRGIGRVRAWPVGEAGRLKPEQRYRARLSIELDASRLPKPFQINLIGSGDWTLDGRYEWEFSL